MIDGLRLVYGRRGYVAAAIALFPTALIFYAWAGQVLIVAAGGVSYLIQPDVIVAVVVLAALLALSLPLQVYALKLAMASALQVGGSVVGTVIGTASLGCCAPVILPSLLSLLGLSGTTILSVNITVHRYFVPLALLSMLLLGYSIVSTAESLAETCVVDSVAGIGLPRTEIEGESISRSRKDVAR